MRLRRTRAPYKLLGKPVTTIDFVLPNRRYETIRGGQERKAALVFVADDGDSGDGIDLQD